MDVFKNVPFGNSVFQIQNFTAGKETPQRRYRHCLLQLKQKYNALKECEFRRKRIDIDIEEIKGKLNSTKDFEKQRLEVDLEEKEYQLSNEIKLIEDCVIEVAVYKRILEDLPEFTREEFEQAEQEYWGKRLLNDARREIISTTSISPQTVESLENIGIIIGKNQKGQITYSKEERNDILRLSKTDNDRNEIADSETNVE